jgi:hypothetical protein
MAGRGAGGGKVGGSAGVKDNRGPVSSSTVDEQMRINFTRQLLKLRNDTVEEVVSRSNNKFNSNMASKYYVHEIYGILN